jgi:APA family basic amino acid/polyamine antiporter
MDESESIGLSRSLGFFSLTNIVIANMVGAGIFTTSGLLIACLKDPLIMLALWFIGGAIALCGALAYGRLGVTFPQAGGEYVFLSELYHPIFGFLSGWTSFVVGFSAPIAASAIGCSEYLDRAFPAMFEWTIFGKGSEIPGKIFAVLVIVLFTFIHMRGIKTGVRIQNGLTVLKVVLVVTLIIGGLFLGGGNVKHFFQHQPFQFGYSGWKTIGLSLMWIMFAYSGWNASTYVGSEVRNPRIHLPRSLLAGTGIVTLLYLALNGTFIYALSPTEMSGVISVGGLAMGSLFGASMESITSVLIAFCLFSSLSAFLILGPRVYYAMARDGLFFRSMAYIHPRYAVPSRSIALQGAFAVVMVLSGTFDQILTFMGFSLGIFPVMAALGVFALRKRHPETATGASSRAAASFYALMGSAILILAYLERPAESSVALATVMAGIPMFAAFRRYSKIYAEVRK